MSPKPPREPAADVSRERRAAGQRILDALAPNYLARPDVTCARMFGSHGLAVRGKFFAFIGRDGQLILKLPAAQAATLLAEGRAAPVTIGPRQMREWVGIPLPATAGARSHEWRRLLAHAHRYLLELTTNPEHGGSR